MEKFCERSERVEKLDFKLRKCKLDIEYLETCLKNGLVPKFLNFKVANSTLCNSKSYKDCQLSYYGKNSPIKNQVVDLKIMNS